jgi:Icc-related predicted phosphoesterase
MSAGAPVIAGVGSAAVRTAIERYQPPLSLHGHIHESRGAVKIGRTLCINPGSEYNDGILRGAVVTLSGKGLQRHQLLAG